MPKVLGSTPSNTHTQIKLLLLRQFIKYVLLSQAWWLTSKILALRMLRQNGYKLKASLAYTVRFRLA